VAFVALGLFRNGRRIKLYMKRKEIEAEKINECREKI
jgi:hypothetical protein